VDPTVSSTLYTVPITLTNAIGPHIVRNLG
jgi:hypothetical protein